MPEITAALVKDLREGATLFTAPREVKGLEGSFYVRKPARFVSATPSGRER